MFLNRFANYIILTRRSLYSLVINLHSLTRNCNPLCSRPLPTLLPNDVVVNGKLTPATRRITNQFSWKEELPAGLLLFCSNGSIFPSTKLHGTRLTFRPLTSVSGGLREVEARYPLTPDVAFRIPLKSNSHRQFSMITD